VLIAGGLHRIETWGELGLADAAGGHGLVFVFFVRYIIEKMIHMIC
jgi:hypothetical protein